MSSSKVCCVAASKDETNISAGEPTPQRLVPVSSRSEQTVSNSSGFLAGWQCPACYYLFWMTTGHISCEESCAHLQLTSACFSSLSCKHVQDSYKYLLGSRPAKYAQKEKGKAYNNDRNSNTETDNMSASKAPWEEHTGIT